MWIDEELTNHHQNIKEEIKYATPKPVNEVGISYVTMKDFIFDTNQQAQVV